MRNLIVTLICGISVSCASLDRFDLAWCLAMLAILVMFWPYTPAPEPKIGDGTFTIPTGVSHVHFRMVGAGGGGGNDKLSTRDADTLALNPNGTLKLNPVGIRHIGPIQDNSENVAVNARYRRWVEGARVCGFQYSHDGKNWYGEPDLPTRKRRTSTPRANRSAASRGTRAPRSRG